MADDHDYALGHSDAELKRLSTQARLIDPITNRYFVAAGISEGMRVLEVGSGAGDVALLLAALVGPGGEVVGTDLSQTAIDIAQQRARSAGHANVTFRQGDPALMRFDRPFDAVAGRYVLQFIPDPSAALAKLASHLRPGGTVVFHELDWNGARSAPPVPTYDQACLWIKRTLAQAGAQTDLGAKLGVAFERAGLPAPTLRLEAVIGSGAASMDAVHLVTDLVATLLPKMERFGIVAASEIEPTDLARRILAEVARDGTLIGRAEVGAWTTV
jgi:SAM-dependent methyltransferase